MTSEALRAPPPLNLSPGHANEEGESRGMAAPKSGAIEIVNKNKDGEIIAVVVAQNLQLGQRATLGSSTFGVLNNSDEWVRKGCMPEQTVVCGGFGSEVRTLDIALFYGAKYKSVERQQQGSARDNFEFVKGYRVQCAGRNVLLKYKGGDLEVQRGAAGGLGLGKKRSVGGGIDMKTNVTELEPIAIDS